MDDDKNTSNTDNSAGNGRDNVSKGRLISYNVPDGERPDGIKVRFKIRVATGETRERDRRAAGEVIMEVLQWQRQHKQQT